jgi:hypothetical protein
MNTMTDWRMKFNNCYTIEPGKGSWRFDRLDDDQDPLP